MTHPLDGAQAKLARGNEHLDALEAEMAAVPSRAHGMTLSQEFDPDRNVVRIKIAKVPEYPLRWSLILGDALHNCRAALDYVAWELARWNLKQQGAQREPFERTQYPICRDADHFKSGGIRNQYQDIAPSHIAIIEDLQPYGTRHLDLMPSDWSAQVIPAWIARHPLTHLNPLSNTDKHRTLHLLSLGSSETQIGDFRGVDCVIGPPNYRIQPTFQAGAELVEVEVIPNGPNPRVEMDHEITPRIAFEQGWPVEPVCESIVAYIRMAIDEFTALIV